MILTSAVLIIDVFNAMFLKFFCQLRRFGADVYFGLVNHIVVFNLKFYLIPS
jgi:hypothetical protein